MIFIPLSKQDRALKKHSVNVFSEWARRLVGVDKYHVL